MTADPDESSFCKALDQVLGTVTVLDSGAVSYKRIWCCFEIFKSLTRKDFLYDVVTAEPHFLNRHFCDENHPRSAATILDGPAEVDKSCFNSDGSFKEAGYEAGYAHYKTMREAKFPDELCDKALKVIVENGEASVRTDRVHILKCIARLPPPSRGTKPEDWDCEEPPATHSKYDEVSRALRGRFAASALRRAVEAGGERLECYLKALEGAHKVSTNFNGCEAFTTEVMKKVIDALPPTLVTLELPISNIVQALPESIGRLSALESLNLGSCVELQALPVSIGRLSEWLAEWLDQLLALKSLNLGGWELQALPESIGRLSALESLDLSGCKQLQALPEWLGRLSALKSLNLGNCDELQVLPESIGQLSALELLNLRGCELQALPESIGRLSALESLNLYHCKRLQVLPESISWLSALESLNLAYCFELQALPESIGQLSVLESLNLENCFQLQALPESIGQLSALELLNLGGCELQALPESIGRLSALESLNLQVCMVSTFSIPDVQAKLPNCKITE